MKVVFLDVNPIERVNETDVVIEQLKNNATADNNLDPITISYGIKAIYKLRDQVR